MKYGMNLLLWADGMSDDLMPVLEMIKEAGFDGVEVPVFETDIAHWESWGKRLDDLGLGRTGVTVRGEDDNPISADPDVRARGVAATKLALDCCQAVGAETLAGPYHSALGVFSGKGPTEDEWNWGVDSMREVAEHADKAGVNLGIESLNRFETYLINCVTDTVRFVKDVDHPRCRMMYDVFHANIEEKDVAAAIREASELMIHVHICENDRSTPGAGGANWKATFDALIDCGYDGWLTIEAFGQALPELAAATKVWRSMFDSPEQLAKDGLAFMKAEIAARS
jgi:D-psicose/D-tagatose/L-ribulose 3-epimerase